MKPYSSLTERGQALRLRHLAFHALQQYSLKATRLRLVTNEMNGIFRVDNSDGRKLILRVTLPQGGHTLDHVCAEMDWLAALGRDTDLSVPRPIPAINGDLVVEAHADGVPEPRLCAVFSWVPGKDLAEDLTPGNVFKLGQLMARLHLHAKFYQPPRQLSLLKFERVFPFDDLLVLFEEENAAMFTAERREIYQTGIAWAQESIDRLKASGAPTRILHGDLHQWNVRISRGVLSPIDFEDLMMGWPVQDIATSLYYLHGESFEELRQAFKEGYSQIIPWPECFPGEIDSFIAARGIGLANFILNDPNPSWRIQAAEFIERVEKRIQFLLNRSGREL